LAAALGNDLDALERVAADGAQALVDLRRRAPDYLTLRGAAGILNEFYGGSERAFERLARDLDGVVPSGEAWHQELLDQMCLDVPEVRPPVLRRRTQRALDRYRRFRHLARNVYGFDLDWERLEPLLRDLPGVWGDLRSDLEAFRGFLEGGDDTAPE